MKRIALILSATVLLLTSCTTKQFPQAEYDQAYEALISENYTQAVKKFARLSSKYSVYPEIWYQYGSCCMETGDYDTAMASFYKAAELYENSVICDDKPGLHNDALVTIGEVHLLRHDFISAKDQFEKCLSLKNDRDMIIEIAATYIRLGFTAECEAYFAEKGIDFGRITLNMVFLTLYLAC